MKNNLMTRKNINVDKANNIPIASFKQEDDVVLKLALFSNGVALDCTNQTFKIGATRKDGVLIELTTGYTINKNEIDIILTNNIIAVPGIIECDLEIKDASGKLTTASFFITSNKKVLGDTSISGTNEVAALEKVNQWLEESKETLDYVNQNMAEIDGVKLLKGDKGEQGPQGLSGPQGPQGIQGPKGETGLGATQLEATKQDKVDNSLVTNAKSIPGAINELSTSLDNIEKQKANETDMQDVKTSINSIQYNVIESNTKFNRISNLYGNSNIVQEQDIQDMVVYKSTDVSNPYIFIIFKYDDSKDIRFRIGQAGVNKLFTPFHGLQTKNNTGQYPLKLLTNPDSSIYGASTDWIGPMVVQAINNGDGTTIDNYKFTGGFHGDTGALTGNPTARNVSYQFLVDGVDKTNDSTTLNINCKKVEVVTTNRLYGFNTTSFKREIIEEKHHYIIKCKKGVLDIEIFAEVKALEDVKMHYYYGIQSHGASNTWIDSVHFVNGEQKNRVSFNDDLNSGKRGDYNCSRTVQRGVYDLISWIDGSYGLGTMEFCELDTPCVKIVNSTKKLYYNLIYKKDGVLLKTGEKFCWHGGYTLTQPSNDNVVDADFIKLENDRFVKVVDFIKFGTKEINTNQDYITNVTNIIGGIGYNKIALDGKINVTCPNYGSIEIIE